MQYKYKLVLSLSQELERPLDRDLQELVFKYKSLKGINYDFVSGYSFELENDINTFQKKGYLEKKCWVYELEIKDKIGIQALKNRINRGEEIEPITSDVVTTPSQNTLFTIGYEGKSIDYYINQLLKNNVKCLVDVRRNAYSNKFGFKKNELQYCLSKRGIEYIHIPELGIDSEKRKEAKVGAYKESNNMSLFTGHGESGTFSLFKEYKENLNTKEKFLNQLLVILEKHKFIAITCFEAKHRDCHRHIISDNLEEKVCVVHL